MNTNNSPFVRVLGKSRADSACISLDCCPDILEMSDGNFAIIGKDITDEAKRNLPPGTGCGPGERLIVIPRSILLAARPDIPTA